MIQVKCRYGENCKGSKMIGIGKYGKMENWGQFLNRRMARLEAFFMRIIVESGVYSVFGFYYFFLYCFGFFIYLDSFRLVCFVLGFYFCSIVGWLRDEFGVRMIGFGFQFFIYWLVIWENCFIFLCFICYFIRL